MKILSFIQILLFLFIGCSAERQTTLPETDQPETKANSMGFSKEIEEVSDFLDVRFCKVLSQSGLSEDQIKKITFNRLTVFSEHNEILSEDVLLFGAGLGKEVDQLHKEGITGQGVKIAIIDQNLAGNHPEFSGKILEYRDMGCEQPEDKGSMHGPAVASLLVGENLGTAPGAGIYYYAAPSWTGDAIYYADAVLAIIETNRSLPPNEKIRAISVSAAPGGQGTPFDKNTGLWLDVVQKAEEENILVLDCTYENGIISSGYFKLDNPREARHILSGWPNRPHFPTPENRLTVPSSYRTVAEEYESGEFGYTYTSLGGLSWSIPYAAGVCAMAWQVNPSVSAAEMRQLLLDTALVTELKDRVINPQELIEAVRKLLGQAENPD